MDSEKGGASRKVARRFGALTGKIEREWGAVINGGQIVAKNRQRLRPLSGINCDSAITTHEMRAKS